MAAAGLVGLVPVLTLLEILEGQNADCLIQADDLAVLETENTVERARVEGLVVLGQAVERMAWLEALAVLGQVGVQMAQVEVQDTA